MTRIKLELDLFFSRVAPTRFSVGARALGVAIAVSTVARTVQAYPMAPKSVRNRPGAARSHIVSILLRVTLAT